MRPIVVVHRPERFYPNPKYLNRKNRNRIRTGIQKYPNETYKLSILEFGYYPNRTEIQTRIRRYLKLRLFWNLETSFRLMSLTQIHGIRAVLIAVYGRGVMCDDRSVQVISSLFLPYTSLISSSLKSKSSLFRVLQYLRHLNHTYCNLQEEIPSSLGNLSHLTLVDLSHNSLTGKILE
ncbi:hypothetical protein YC2023_016661 [Brassica napus]